MDSADLYRVIKSWRKRELFAATWGLPILLLWSAMMILLGELAAGIISLLFLPVVLYYFVRVKLAMPRYKEALRSSPVRVRARLEGTTDDQYRVVIEGLTGEIFYRVDDIINVDGTRKLLIPQHDAQAFLWSEHAPTVALVNQVVCLLRNIDHLTAHELRPER